MTHRTTSKNFNKFLFGTAIASIAMASPAQAEPWDSFTDDYGNISIDTSTSGHTQIIQSGNLYIGTSSNLNVPVAQSVTINQDSTSSLFVGKSANGVDPTRILGTLRTRLNGNASAVGGSVAIFDPNGVIFGANSMVDTGGIIASTGELDNDRLINDGVMEISNFGSGVVVNHGTMTIANGGLAAFVAPTVVNNGVINAPAGRVQLGASNTKTTVDLYGDGLMELVIDEENEETLRAINRGEIVASGGVIQMTAGAAKNVVDSIVNLDGITRADSVSQVGGKIVLGGSSTGRVIIQDKVQARGGAGGGEIEIAAKEINMLEGAIINVRAFDNGNGGTVTLSASDKSVLRGRIRAMGGDNGGNGGTINTSAVNILRIREDLEIDASAANGTNGSWVIDPINFVINPIVAGVFQTTLNGGTNVSAAATNDITINSLMAWTGTGALALDAGNDVIFNASVDGAGNFTVDAGRNIDVLGGNTVAVTDANLDFNAGSDVFVRNGAEVSVTNGNLEIAADNANGGNSAIEIDGTLRSDNGDIALEATNYFVEINSTGEVFQTNGTFTAISNTGFDIDGGATVDLGTADVDIQAPDVRLGADINTTGNITGTATLVAVENATAEIQDGVDVAGNGAQLNISDDTYSERVVIDKDLTITGESRSGTIVTPDADTGTSGDARGWWLVEAGADVDVSNMTFDGAGYQVWQGIRHRGEGSFDNVSFKNINYNPSTNYQGTAIAAFGNGPVDVTNSSFENMGRIGVLYFGAGQDGAQFTDNTYTGKGDGDWLDYALDINAGAKVNVVRNTITGNTGVASSDGSTSAAVLLTTSEGTGTEATISNNFINGNTTAVAVGFNGADTSVVTAHDNDLSGNDFGVVNTSALTTADFSGNWWGSTDEATVAALMGGAESGNIDFTPYLNFGTDTDAGTNGFQGDFSRLHVSAMGSQTGTTGRIQEAVDLIEDGQATGNGRAVFIKAGTFDQGATIDKAMIIQGSGRTATTIMPGSTNDGLTIDGDLGAGRVLIQSLGIDGARNGVVFANSATANLLELGGVLIQNSGFNGLRVGGNYTDVNLNNLKVSNAEFYNNGAPGGARGDGDIVAFYYNGDASFNNVTIQNDGALEGIEGDYGIQFRGRGDGTTFPPVNDAAMGTVSFNNVTVIGDYRSALIGIQGYTDTSGLSFNDVTLGGTTNGGADSQAWGSLYLSSTGSNDIDLGNTVFNSIDGQYIILAAGAGYSTANNIDATGVTFEGITGATATLAQQFDIEDKVFHAIDLSGQGLVTWNPGNLYVTEGATAFGQGAIQRAVDNSGHGDNVFVKAGTYDEAVNVDVRGLNLYGAQAGTSGKAFSRLGGSNESIVTGASPAFSVDANDVTIDGFTMDGPTLTYGVYIDDQYNTTIVNNIVKNSSVAGFGGVIDHDPTVRATIIDNNKIDQTNTGDGINLQGDNAGRAGGDAIMSADIQITNNQIGSVFGGGVGGNGIKFSELGDFDGSSEAAGVRSTVATVLIEGNSINANDDGVEFEGTVKADVTINDNFIRSGEDGVQFSDTVKSSDVKITDNIISGDDDGVEFQGDLRGSTLEITDNLSIRGDEEGIDIDFVNNSDITIADNGSIRGEDGDGIQFDDTIRKSEVTIANNFSIRGGDDGVDFEDIRQSEVTISGTDFITADNDNGIEFDGIINNSDIFIENNDLILAGSNGIAVEDEVKGNGEFLIQSNVIAGSNNAILVSGDLSNDNGSGQDFRITDNLLLGGGNGIKFTGTMSGSDHSTKIDRNRAILSFGNAIVHNGAIAGGAEFKINKNDIVGGANNGILVRADITDGSLVRVKENTIGALSGDSIKVVNTAGPSRGGSTVEILRNDVLLSGNNGVTVDNVQTVTIHGNTIDNSGNNGIKVINGGNVDISNANIVTNSGRNGIVVTNDLATTRGSRSMMLAPFGLVNISDNEVTGSGANGIKSVGVNNVTIDTNIVTDSGRNGIVVEGTAATPIIIRPIGIFSRASTFLTPSGPIITNNIVSNSGSNGIKVTDASDAIVSVNDISNSGTNGINALGTDNADISSNIIAASGTNGIKVTDSSNVSVSENNVEDSGRSGLLAERTPDITISQNILNNSTNGIEIDGEIDQAVLITGNTLTDNETGMLLRGGLINFTDLANPNIITGGITAMELTPDAGESDSLGLVADTFGNTVLAGMTGNYFELSNGALFNPGTPTVIDAFGVSFDGFVPLANQLAPGIIAGADRDRIEARIIDFDDNGSTGDLFVGAETLDLNDDDLFALNFFSLDPNAGLVNVVFTGLPFTSAAVLNNIGPAAGGGNTAAALNNITPAAGGDGVAFELANIEPAAGVEEGCWSTAADTQFSGPVSFSFGGDVSSNLSGGAGCE